MIRESLAAARQKDAKRGDELLCHVSDLYSCDRATWYRRQGLPQPEPDEASLRKFDVGHAVEAQIAKRLSEAGIVAERDVLVALRVENGMLRSEIYDQARREVEGNVDPTFADDDVVGHLDLFIPWDTVVEIKTTDVRKPDPQCKPHYQIQAAAYALAVHARRAIVHVTHVANFTKDEVEYELDPQRFRARVTERVAQVVAETAPGAPMPMAVPEPESAAWACKYCRWTQCEANPAAQYAVIPA